MHLFILRYLGYIIIAVLHCLLLVWHCCFCTSWVAPPTPKDMHTISQIESAALSVHCYVGYRLYKKHVIAYCTYTCSMCTNFATSQCRGIVFLNSLFRLRDHLLCGAFVTGDKWHWESYMLKWMVSLILHVHACNMYAIPLSALLMPWRFVIYGLGLPCGFSHSVQHFKDTWVARNR